MAVRNANDAISMVQTADGAAVEVSNMLQRMRELAVQAASETTSATDRDALDVEFEALTAEIERIADNTQWNGTTLLDGTIGTNGAVAFQIGANASQTVTVTFADFETAHASMVSTGGLFEGLDNAPVNSGTTGNNSHDLASRDVDTTSNAGTAITQIDFALTHLNTHRAALGAAINRLEYAADNLANVSQNTSASRSRVLDADYACLLYTSPSPRDS